MSESCLDEVLKHWKAFLEIKQTENYELVSFMEQSDLIVASKRRIKDSVVAA
jgi:hypothetical protein